MTYLPEWTRRQFLALTSCAAADSHPLLQAAKNAAAQASVIPPPIVITGGIQPLFESGTALPLRYEPAGKDFIRRNGGEFFNRPIYGAVSDFRVDAGDRPEFSLYLPGHGGNLKLGFANSSGAKFAAEANEVIARYRAGRMIYEVRDRLLGTGLLRIELLTAAQGSGLLVKVEATAVPAGTALTWVFAGCSGRKGRRNGDIGCEVEPVSRFFQVRPEECSDNRYKIEPNDNSRATARLSSRFCELAFSFPLGSSLEVGDFSAWSSAPPLGRTVSSSPKLPILVGSVELDSAPLFLTIDRVEPGASVSGSDPAAAFDARSKQVAAIADAIQIETPDPYINPVAPALGVVADALWDPNQQCVMHGCVAWRVALAGWRGPYVLDATGNHRRAKTHFRHWIAKQNLSPIATGDPATGPADPNMRLARKEHLLHSNGDLSGNHYDMNMVFFDVLLRHLRWTGDLAFAREIWPAFKRHLAWERRLFRRTFKSASGEELPLYEAYAAIWASDNLQYSGGGAAHSSAYNVFSFRFAAQLARLLGDDPAPYQHEATLIRRAMQEFLWLPRQGAFAESKDLMGPQTVYNNPALWTVYHTIDSEVPDPRQAWQMAAERLAAIRHIPVHGIGVPSGPWFLLACSDWLPYMWSLNLIILAENMHFALAMWQTGMRDEAYALFKGNVFDSMYQGLCPGDFHMTSALDDHRQEAQRDFGDPTGITSRALVEGLFGVQPDLIGGVIRIRPGFPAYWDRATMHHADFDLAWRRQGSSETWEFTSRFPRQVQLTLLLPARTTRLPEVTSSIAKVDAAFDPSAVGSPILKVTLQAAASYKVEIKWHGQPPTEAPAQRTYKIGDTLDLPKAIAIGQIDDPQQCLASGKLAASGFHTVFANLHEGDCQWTLPISFQVDPANPLFVEVPAVPRGAKLEAIDLSPVLSHSITQIFERSYTEPRSKLCTLSIPDNLVGGWANILPSPPIDDAGLRAAGGLLKTPLGVTFVTPKGSAPNCIFLSHFVPDKSSISLPLGGTASGIYLLMAGSTLPQCSRMQHGSVTVTYADGTSAQLSLRNPETWWPIEQDYLLDDFLFVDKAPPPPRVDLRTGQTRLLDYTSFQGKGRSVPGGAANLLHLALDPAKPLASLRVEVDLWGIAIALLSATLLRA